ncbi:MAG: exodeoxyribonuclease VII small subunit [Holophagaceae bacterium]|jgi:exodeoxyribonuclease VII small subunit|nr:exodeoxyribonuclease VII small subunit [Holophagaceae bacterium]
MGKDQFTFDEGLDRLEAMVQKLEGGDLGLEDALRHYEDGMKLSVALQEQLEGARRKVDVLRQGMGGEYVAEPLEGDDE